MIDISVVTTDNLVFFEGTNPPQAGRGRYADALGQFNVGHSAISLKIPQNPAVDIIEFYFASHGPVHQAQPVIRY